VGALSDDLTIDAEKIADDLDRDGFICLENAVSPEWLAHAQADVNNRLARFGEKFFSVIRPANEADSAAEQLVADPRLAKLLRDLTTISCPAGVSDYEEVYNVLRIIAGPDGSKGSLEFHYDASVVTALVPIFIPEGGDHGEGSGSLVTFANNRPYRSLPVNLAEKAIVQNKRYAERLFRRYRENPEPHTQALQPGNIYLFWGYRTLHGNLSCAANSKRATMLLHYGNPHGSNPVLKAVRNRRRQVEAQRRETA
jgi:hypothetical protein